MKKFLRSALHALIPVGLRDFWNQFWFDLGVLKTYAPKPIKLEPSDDYFHPLSRTDKMKIWLRRVWEKFLRE